MARIFQQADYTAALKKTITIEEALPPGHLARWLVQIIATWDLTRLYALYAPFGPPPYAPEILLAVTLYGYMTGVIGSRALEQAVCESLPFRFLADFRQPDHTTLARFRTACLPLLAGWLVQLLDRAHAEGLLDTNPVVSADGSKIHADASKHHAVSYGYACRLRDELRVQIAQLQALEAAAVPEGMDPLAEIALRLDAVQQLEQAIAVIEARANERYQQELAVYQAKMAERERRAQANHRKPGGRPPVPPSSAPNAKDQYNFTDPDARVMKNSTNKGFDQHYNVQIAVDQQSRLIVGQSLSNHANDKREATAAIDAIPPSIGPPRAAALDNGYFSTETILELEARRIIPLISTHKEAHGLDWQHYYQTRDTQASQDPTSPLERMLQAMDTTLGHTIYSHRKSTVEPAFGTIKEAMGFSQFSLRGTEKVSGEWTLVCLAYDLRRLRTLEASANAKRAYFCRKCVTIIAHFAHWLFGRPCRERHIDQQQAQLAINVTTAGTPPGGWRYATSC
jgi:transposase